MKLKYYPLGKLKKEILEIISKYLDLKEYRVFFFGSRIKENQDEKADIDIGIEGKKPMPEETLYKIKEEISELPILYKIDIVDFKRVDKDFYQVAKQNIELLN